VKPAVVLPPERDESWDHAAQLGVSHVVAGFPNVEDRHDDADPWDFDPLLQLSQRFADAGFELGVIEARPPMDAIRLGTEGRDEQIEMVKTLLRNMGKIGIDVWCPSWMAVHGGHRTSLHVPDRGDSEVSAYDHDLLAEAPPEPAAASVTEADLWENLEYFLEAVVPVAEETGVKMAMHPDDPPVSPSRGGVPRILTSVEAGQRLLDMYDSEYNGLCLGQGSLAATGDADIPAAIRQLGDRIHYAHFRDVTGTPEQFRETWHDDGPTDMAAAVRAYRDVGFEGLIRPDHVPVMTGDPGMYPHHYKKARLFVVGYLRGLVEQDEAVR
jgi:mannonate dehydratase